MPSFQVVGPPAVGRWLVVLGLLSARQAAAEVRFTFEAGAFSRTQVGLDLAELAGTTEFGAGSDATPLSMGLHLAFGVQISELEVGAMVGLAVGGLDLAGIEERYLGATDDVGGSSTLTAGLRGLWVPALSDEWQLMLGPQGAWQVLGAASGVGQGSVSSLGFGGLVGARWRLHAVSPTLDGHLQLTAEGLAHVPLSVVVRQGSETDLFASNAPEGVFGSFGFGLAYSFAFK